MALLRFRVHRIRLWSRIVRRIDVESRGFRLALRISAGLLAGLIGTWAYSRAGASVIDLARDLAVGWIYITTGLIACWRRPGNRVGDLMYIEGLTWFLGNLEGTGVPALIGVGRWLEALNMAVFGHLLLAFPSGRLTTRPGRVITAAAYLAVLGGGLLRAVTFDPSQPSSAYLLCQGCRSNALLLVHNQTLATVVDDAFLGVGAVITVTVVAVVLRRWAASPPPYRRALSPAMIGLTAGAGFVAWDVVVEFLPGDFGSLNQPFEAAADVCQALLPIAFLVGLLKTQLRRASALGLAVTVGADAEPSTLQAELVGILGDPSLRLGFWSFETEAYLDPTHKAMAPSPAPGRRTIAIGPVERPLALLEHDASVEHDPELISAISASTLTMIDLVRLRTEASTSAAEAAAAQARAARAGTDERRRIERDLHDGAQASLMTALMAMRQVGDQVRAGAGSDLSASVAEADRSLRRALDELRSLARGIYPAVLTRSGLAAAVTALAEQCPVAVVVAVTAERFPEDVEATVYFVVCEALTNAVKHSGAVTVRVAIWREATVVMVEVLDDGGGGADPGNGSGLTGLAQRLSAAGGALTVQSPLGRGTRVHAELPCG
jgi:signal transduction histidine kinase